jgi:hypothetical protein
MGGTQVDGTSRRKKGNTMLMIIVPTAKGQRWINLDQVTMMSESPDGQSVELMLSNSHIIRALVPITTFIQQDSGEKKTTKKKRSE